MQAINDIIAKKLECKISIKGNSYDDIKFLLREKFSESLRKNLNEPELLDNSIEEFFKYYYYSTQGKELKASVYFVDYKENEGSFIATFTFLIITTFNSYASVRQGIDTFMKDVTLLLKGTLNNNVLIEGRVENEVDIAPLQALSQSPIKPQRDFRLVVLFSFILSIVLAVFLTYFSVNNSEKDDEKALDYKIEKKLKEEINQQKLDYLFYSKYFTDTVNHSKIRQLK